MDTAVVLPSCFMGKIFQDDLPSICVSRLRASGAITTEMTRTTIGIADVEAEVGLDLVRFRNGNSWSFFRCPCCGLRARVLKLFDGCVLCWRCCHRRGAGYRAVGKSPRRRAELRIPKLLAMLQSEQSLRLKPHLYGTMERRKRLEWTCPVFVESVFRFYAARPSN
jgi:hypothetical protein